MVLLTLTGESGTGKSTIARSLLQLRGFQVITSSTTRAARPSDLPQEYEYLSQTAFEQLNEENIFLWTIPYAGHHYGTRQAYIDQALSSEGVSLLILVPKVVPLLVAYTNKVIPFFIRTPPEAILRERMLCRGDAPENIEKRLQHLGIWEKEAEEQERFYRFITNEGPIEDAVAQILSSVGKP